jgi:hypothetical protein
MINMLSDLSSLHPSLYFTGGIDALKWVVQDEKRTRNLKQSWRTTKKQVSAFQELSNTFG